LNEGVIDLTRGVPPADVFPVDDLIECGQVALRRDPHTLLQYSRTGYGPLRAWLGEQYGVAPERIVTGNSSLEVFRFVAESLLCPGDRVFVERPTYDRTITLLRRVGAEVVGIPVEEDGLNIGSMQKELERGVPSLMYIIPDFQNPMGITTSLQKRQQLVELAREHDFWIVEDGPYRKLRYWGEDVVSLWSMAPERVLHMSSFSKILAPGLRLGYVVSPELLVGPLTKWAEDSHIGPVLPTQGMVFEYCRRGLLEVNVERLKGVYRPRLEAVLGALDEQIPQVDWTRPEGGFFVSGFLPQGHSIGELRARAAEDGLKLSDGRGFFPEPSDGDHFLRIPFCSLTPEQIEEGVSRLAGLL
jgi:2-aminoadipate transaminase